VRIYCYLLWRLRLTRLGHTLRETLHLAYRKALGHNLFGDFALQFGRDSEQTSGVTLREPSVRDEVLDIRRKLQEAKDIGDSATILASALADLFVAEIQLFGHSIEGESCLDGV